MKTICPECKGERTIGTQVIAGCLDEINCSRCDGTGEVVALTFWECRDLERDGIRALDGVTVTPVIYGNGQGIAVVVNGRRETYPWSVIPEEDLAVKLVVLKRELSRRMSMAFVMVEDRCVWAEVQRHVGSLARVYHPLYGTFYAHKKSTLLGDVWFRIPRVPFNGYGI